MDLHMQEQMEGANSDAEHAKKASDAHAAAAKARAGQMESLTTVRTDPSFLLSL